MASALDDALDWLQRQIPPAAAQPPASRMTVVDDRASTEPVVAPPAIDRVTPSSLGATVQQGYQAIPSASTVATPPPPRMRAVSDLASTEPAVMPPTFDRITPSSLAQTATGAVSALQGAVPPAGPGRPLPTTGPVGYADINPPEAPSPRPGETEAERYRRETGAASASDATRAILAARPNVPGFPNADPTVAVEGAEPAIVSAAKAVAQHITKDVRPKKEEPAPAATTTVQAGAPAATTPAPVDLRKPIKAKGAGGARPPSALGGRKTEELPDALEKSAISPRFLVELEKSNPALHDGIIQAATAAGIGSWDYANLIYASSKGDPNFNAGGRVGLAGLNQQDVERYRKERPELFRDGQGNPVGAEHPTTSLMVGALKYRELRDNYGAKTPMSVLAYHLGQDKVDAISRLMPKEQAEHIPPATRQQVQQTFQGPDAGAPHMPQVPMTITPLGTATASQTARVMTQAAASGNAMPFISYAVNSLPRGMGSNDGWRYLENQMVSTMMRTGNVEGAQRVREMLFQMSHVGSNQALMSAYKQMQMGDYQGSAQQLALAYWAAPDGGLAQFSVGKDKNGNQVMFGQRYNEETKNPVGPTFQVTPERLIEMMNVTRDPNSFAKTVKDNQKLHADIADKEASTEQKRAHAQYYRDLLPSQERRASEAGEDRALAAAARALQPPKGGAGAGNKLDPRVEKATAQVHPFFKTEDPVTKREQTLSPEEAIQMDIAVNMKLHNDSLTGSLATVIARDLRQNPTGGKYEVKPHPNKPGWGAVYDRATKAPVSELDPSAARQFKSIRPAGAAPAAGAAPTTRAPAAPGLSRAAGAGA